MAKKPIPLIGDFLSTGVSIEKATPTQLNMESGRLLNIVALRFVAAKDQGINVEQDEQYIAAITRNKMLSKLTLQRMKELSDLHGIKIDLPELPY